MFLKNAYERLIKDKKFVEWQKKHQDFYLAHAFIMVGAENNLADWQFGYYNPKTDKLVSFIIVGDELKQVPEKEIMKERGKKIGKLIFENIKINLEDLFGAVDKILNEKYNKVKSVKTVIIAQNLGTTQKPKEVFNVTVLTDKFSMINMRISVENGKVLEHKKTQIFSGMKGQKLSKKTK